MKRTQVTDLFANIKATFVSFFSILMFVALGVGVFLGISWAAPALQSAADNMFDTGNFHNYQIQFPYGLTKADLEKLSDIEGVTQIEAERQSFQTLEKGGMKYTVKVQSLGQDIDTPIVVEGELPSKAGEIALHEESAKTIGLSIGDVIVFEKDAVVEEKSTSDEEGKDSDAEQNEPEPENASGMKYLLKSTFTVTAIMNSPDYVAHEPGTYGYSSSPSGGVDLIAWVRDDVFDASAFQNAYPLVNVRCDGLPGDTFSDQYKSASKEQQQPIDKLGNELATARYDDLHDQAQKKIDEAQDKIDKAEEDIAAAEKEVEDGEKQLEEGRTELEQKEAEGYAELNSAYAQLMNGEAKKSAAGAELSEARSKVNAGQAAIDEVDSDMAFAEAEMASAQAYKDTCDAQLEAGKITEEEYNSRLDKRGAQATVNLQSLARKYGTEVPDMDHDNYDIALMAADIAFEYSEEMPVTVDGEEMTLGEARQKLAAAEDELADAEAEYDEAVSELGYGWSQYYNGQATLESEVAYAEEQLAEGEAAIEEAKKQIEEGKAEVTENKPKLEDAKAQLDEMIKYDWTVLPRGYNSGAVEVSTFSGVTNNLSISMAALFIIVGLLVSYFAVSRIVREQMTQIGTKKALGFRKGEITISFLLYSGIAVLAGSIIGAIVAFFLVEGIIDGVLGSMFAFGAYPAFFGWSLFLIITVLELVLVLGATYLACRKILKEHAVDLLRGEQQSNGTTHFYEKWDLWERLPLFIQTIVNNCFNDKRRVLSTIVGVAGCTALIVTAITLNDDVLKSYDRHYEDTYGFNAITYADFETEGAANNLEKALQKEGAATTQVFLKSYLMVQSDSESSAVRIVVPNNEETFSDLYHVNVIDGAEFDPSAEGAWMSQAYADHLGAKVGDTVVVDGGDGSKHEITILGFYKFYLTYNEMVIGKAYFESEFDKITPNVVLTQTGDVEIGDVFEKVKDIEGFDSIIDDAAKQHGNFETFSAVSSAVVLIYLALAVLMAIVVLLNLNVMFIDEKKRELIVLMINGFSSKDARHYISYDTIVLTALGIIVGLILGCVMGSVTVASMEPATASFVKDIDALAVTAGIVGTVILAVIMSLISLHRIPKFNLTDINKF